MEGELHQVVVEMLDTRLVTNGWVGYSLLLGPSVGSSPATPCTW